MTDSEAVQALCRGDQGGLEALVKRHELRALRIAYQITRDPESAKEVVADAFLAVFEHLDGSNQERPFEPWFVRIVINRAISVARRATRYQKILSLLGRSQESSDPETCAVQNEMHRALAVAVRSLPPQERAALALRYLLDPDDRGVAEALGWPLGTVKTRLHRGRARLRKRLEADDHGFWTMNAMESE